MKIIQAITIILILSSCFTIIDTSKISNTLEVQPIIDNNVFLPDSTSENEKTFIKNLCQNWVESAKKQNQIIWQPKHYKELSKRRFRAEIIFKKSGEYSVLKLSPNDAHYFEKSRWRLDKENDRRIIVFNAKGEKEYSMVIEKLDPVTLIFGYE